MMKLEMGVVEMEALLEKIWYLHDKLSDAIHSISRIHFLNSMTRIPSTKNQNQSPKNFEDDNRAGFVYVKDFYDESALQEAKSLHAIRTALENLEDQLDFFNTVQMQQRAERDAAIAGLEQSRIVLAMKLAEHHGKKYKVIEEALAFVGDVNDSGRFISAENLFDENLVSCKGKQPSNWPKLLISSFHVAKNFLKMDYMGEILGNTALVAVSMFALLHFHQVGYKGNFDLREDKNIRSRNAMRNYRLEGSSLGNLKELDVLLARG